jgi:hypothetical protein
MGPISDEGPGQHNPDRSEGPWGRAAVAARTTVPHRAHVSDYGMLGGAMETSASFEVRTAPSSYPTDQRKFAPAKHVPDADPARWHVQCAGVDR